MTLPTPAATFRKRSGRARAAARRFRSAHGDAEKPSRPITDWRNTSNAAYILFGSAIDARPCDLLPGLRHDGQRACPARAVERIVCRSEHRDDRDERP